MNNTRKWSAAFFGAVILLAAVVVEPFEGDKAVGYRDPVGIPTAGRGHTGADVAVGRFYDQATRDGWLWGDLTSHAKIVERCAPPNINKYQAAAFTSFAFNTGAGRKAKGRDRGKDGFCTLKNGQMPTFLKKAWAGDWTGACNGMLAWDKAGGKRLRGLTRRRHAERDLCMTEDK